jgi:hypothetical protein
VRAAIHSMSLTMQWNKTGVFRATDLACSIPNLYRSN